MLWLWTEERNVFPVREVSETFSIPAALERDQWCPLSRETDSSQQQTEGWVCVCLFVYFSVCFCSVTIKCNFFLHFIKHSSAHLLCWLRKSYCEKKQSLEWQMMHELTHPYILLCFHLWYNTQFMCSHQNTLKPDKNTLKNCIFFIFLLVYTYLHKT